MGKETLVEQVYFKVNTEGILNIFREWWWYEGKPYTKVRDILLEQFEQDESPMEEKLALIQDLLTGKKKMTGVYPDEEIQIVDDDKHDEYKRAIKNIPAEHRIQEVVDANELAELRALKEKVEKEKEAKRIKTGFEEFLEAYKNNTLASYECRYENHENDNSPMRSDLNEMYLRLDARKAKLVGICMNPEWSKGGSLGLVFECQETFEKYWFHYLDKGLYEHHVRQITEGRK